MLRRLLLIAVVCLLSSYFPTHAGAGEAQARRTHGKLKDPKRPFPIKSVPLLPDTLIVNLLAQVNEDSIGATILHLQDYGTRNCTSPQALLAEAWIEEKLSAYGLSVYTQFVPQPSGSSDNVIATLTGTSHPDEYVVIGAHYDSYSWGATAPGADDNASGTAGIIEIARVLSQYTFNRSIVFCLFSAEEYGLHGSEAYASNAALTNMDILAYINLDMCGYLYGTTIRTNVVGPPSAQDLLDYYASSCSLYLPDFQVTIGGNLPGNSDHASFNNHGYMGIFPFEDVDHYSPYIHSPDDLFGTSVNSLPMAAVFARSVLASAVGIAKTITTGTDTEVFTPAVARVTAAPNPFNDQTEIGFYLSRPGHVKLEVFNAIGEKVMVLCDDVLSRGQQCFPFHGASFPGGIYSFRLSSPEQVISGKIIRVTR